MNSGREHLNEPRQFPTTYVTTSLSSPSSHFSSLPPEPAAVFSFFSFLINPRVPAVQTDIVFIYSSSILHEARSRDSIVGTATGYGLDDRGIGVRVPVGSRIFSSPRRPDRLWGSPNLLSNGYRWLFPRG
jgi:hypothetical protein